jgi:hypothetical protein
LSSKADWEYVFIIGAMKAGTTTVFDWLAQHSAILPSISKEPHFFCENSVDQYSADTLDEVWPPVSKEALRYRLEASTGYSKYPFEPDVPQKIRKAGLRPKFIYIVRDPIARIESHYNFMKRRAYFDQSITDAHLINTSNYGLQLRRYLEHFDLSDFLIIDFKSLSADPAHTHERIIHFLDLPFEPVPSYEAKNVTKGTNKIALYLMNSPAKSILKLLPRPLIQTAKAIANRMLPVKDEFVRLSDEQVSTIKANLHDDMLYFAEQTGFDVAQWGFFE